MRSSSSKRAPIDCREAIKRRTVPPSGRAASTASLHSGDAREWAGHHFEDSGAYRLRCMSMIANRTRALGCCVGAQRSPSIAQPRTVPGAGRTIAANALE